MSFGEIVFLFVFLLAVACWILPDVVRDVQQLVTSTREYVRRHRGAQEIARREQARAAEEMAETIQRMQSAYWHAAQQLRDEADGDLPHDGGDGDGRPTP